MGIVLDTRVYIQLSSKTSKTQPDISSDNCIVYADLSQKHSHFMLKFETLICLKL